MFVAVYMIVIVAICLVVYFTLPETGSRAGRATVAAADQDTLTDAGMGTASVSADAHTADPRK